ncbi:MAG: hypothetical protein N2Z72_07410 [Bacteroidales bacterium]|nr:hypothetical protein [Bacteroidales bacterium]
MKKYYLYSKENDFEDNFKIWVLNSPYREYKVVSLLNQMLENPFRHMRDYEHFDVRTSRSYLYPVYSNLTEMAWLIGVRTDEVYLIPEVKPYNLLLCYLEEEEGKMLIRKIKDSTIFSHVQEVPEKIFPKVVSCVQKIHMMLNH